MIRALGKGLGRSFLSFCTVNTRGYELEKTLSLVILFSCFNKLYLFTYIGLLIILVTYFTTRSTHFYQYL